MNEVDIAIILIFLLDGFGTGFYIWFSSPEQKEKRKKNANKRSSTRIGRKNEKRRARSQLASRLKVRKPQKGYVPKHAKHIK